MGPLQKTSSLAAHGTLHPQVLSIVERHLKRWQSAAPHSWSLFWFTLFPLVEPSTGHASPGVRDAHAGGYLDIPENTDHGTAPALAWLSMFSRLPPMQHFSPPPWKTLTPSPWSSISSVRSLRKARRKDSGGPPFTFQNLTSARTAIPSNIRLSLTPRGASA